MAENNDKNVPQRTCVACRQVKPKWELVRIVRTPQGTIEIDPRGKRAGRGAYLCRERGCWDTGLKKKRLEYVLKVAMLPEQRSELLEFSKTLSNTRTETIGAGIER